MNILQCALCGNDFEKPFRPGRPPKLCIKCRPIVTPVHRPDKADCANCGNEFEIFKRRGGIPKYCSVRCNRQWLYRHRRLAELKSKPCNVCGADMPPTTNAVGHSRRPTLYCGMVCKDKAMSARKKARLHASLGDAVVRECAHCGADFEVDPKSPGGLVDSKRYCSIPCQRQGNRERRRARVRGLPNEPINRYRIFERDNWACGLCGDPVDKTIKWPDPMSASLDHIVPVIAGGPHTPDNVQCSHLGCNLNANAKGHPKKSVPKARKAAS